MAYDRLDWHSGGDYPDDLPDENGGTHIGMFLAWACGQGLAGGELKADAAAELRRLADRKITGRDFLIEICDGKLWEDDLNDPGNAFAIDYYTSEKTAFSRRYGDYMQDYCDIFDQLAEARGTEYPSVYHVEDTWENFDRLRPLLDQRFEQWKQWSADPANTLPDAKTQFQQAALAIGEQCLKPLGFTPNKAGTTWKKTAADKDTQFQVVFAPERYNSRKDVRLTAHLSIGSKALKKWPDAQGIDLILSGTLRTPDKYAKPIEWQVAGASLKSAAADAGRLIGERFVPLFELYADRPRALEHLAEHGDGVSGVCEPSLNPLPYLLHFGAREQAQRFFSRFVGSRPGPWRGNIRNTYARLAAHETWEASQYWGEAGIKLAYRHGLTLPG